jgi:hypothetical protein
MSCLSTLDILVWLVPGSEMEPFCSLPRTGNEWMSEQVQNPAGLDHLYKAQCTPALGLALFELIANEIVSLLL